MATDESLELRLRRLFDDAIYFATAPIRLTGRSRAFRWALIAIVIAGGTFAATNWALERFLPPNKSEDALLAGLPAPPPLPPITRTSYVIVPVTIALTAIRDSLEAAVPREFTGKGNDPVSRAVSKADIQIAVSRGSISVTGMANELTVASPISASARVSREFAAQANKLAGSLADLINRSVGKDVAHFSGQSLNRRVRLRGQATVHVKPVITAEWRLDPHMTAELALNNKTLSLAGIKIDVAHETRPLIEKLINNQMARLDQRLRDDSFIERTLRAQWARLCRSIRLGGRKTGLPPLWLEIRPFRAFVAQPQINAAKLTLTVGVKAETRIASVRTAPTCPFPKKLKVVSPIQTGKLAIGLPIDVPFSVLGKLLAAELKGRSFPKHGNSPVGVTVRAVHLAAAGERLLVSLYVHVREKKSWFGFGTNAMVHVWAKPVLDAKNQILHLADISLGLNSGDGFTNAAARAALPYLQQGLAENTVVNLKPLADEARKRIAAVIADFRQKTKGARVDAHVDELRLTGIAFDAHTLRIVAESGGTVKVTLSALPKL